VQAASGYDSGIKSTNYLANIMAKHEADQRGAYDALFLGAKDEIAEMTTASFFCCGKGYYKNTQSKFWNITRNY
jgi:branched-subunit amino acid aminotransferase/4-amino-4-deoxychorismate lyase